MFTFYICLNQAECYSVWLSFEFHRGFTHFSLENECMNVHIVTWLSLTWSHGVCCCSRESIRAEIRATDRVSFSLSCRALTFIVALNTGSTGDTQSSTMFFLENIWSFSRQKSALIWFVIIVLPYFIQYSPWITFHLICFNISSL